MKPSIGRIVHYVNLGDKDGKYPPEVQAAIITGIYQRIYPEDALATPGNNDHEHLGLATANTLDALHLADAPFADLKVQYRTGMFDMKCVPFSEEPKRGHWSFPPRV